MNGFHLLFFLSFNELESAILRANTWTFKPMLKIKNRFDVRTPYSFFLFEQVDSNSHCMLINRTETGINRLPHTTTLCLYLTLCELNGLPLQLSL